MSAAQHSQAMNGDRTYLDAQLFIEECDVVYLEGEEAQLVVAAALAGGMELAS